MHQVAADRLSEPGDMVRDGGDFRALPYTIHVRLVGLGKDRWFVAFQWKRHEIWVQGRSVAHFILDPVGGRKVRRAGALATARSMSDLAYSAIVRAHLLWGQQGCPHDFAAIE